MEEAGRGAESPTKDTIRAWIEPLRRVKGIMERTHRESSRRLDDLVRINNWCAQDLAENAYIGDASGNYEKTLHGLCNICRPHAAWAGRLRRYGGPYDE